MPDGGMAEPGLPARLRRLRRLLAMVATGWTAIAAVSLGWNLYLSSRAVVGMARAEARAAYLQDMGYKRWVAAQGGVYIRVTPEILPDPFLAHLPERDVETTGGQQLTLVNPVYLVQRARVGAADAFGIEARVTSSRALRPETAPDEWERGALERVEAGADEFSEVVDYRGEPYLRSMYRLDTEDRCLKCHGPQGYATGDVRGGISVKLPLSEFRAADRAQRAVLVVGHAALWALGMLALVLGGRRSVTRAGERERAEAALREAQEALLHSRKLEAIGRLAGGLAHDINNMLSPILGYASLVLEQLPPEAPLRDDVEEIRSAAERARDITRRLLAFGRRSPLSTVPLDLSDVVANLMPMLRRLLGERVTIETTLTSRLPAVRADRAQLELVLVNLAINARDAMPRGGTLRISTGLVVPPRESRAGHQVALTVADTGTGMDAETLSHLFEPFFTTKPKGQGTGLGLATAHGIVRQHGGTVDVTSAPGEGTTFRILLPAVADPPQRVYGEQEPAEPEERAAGTVLVAEDDGAVRAFVASALRGLGYEVLVAIDGEDALGVAAAHRGHIDLLLTDVAMPRMSGRELADAFAASRPGTPVLYMSGYVGDVDALGEVDTRGAEVLAKPFTPAELSVAVRSALRRGGPTPADDGRR